MVDSNHKVHRIEHANIVAYFTHNQLQTYKNMFLSKIHNL